MLDNYVHAETDVTVKTRPVPDAAWRSSVSPQHGKIVFSLRASLTDVVDHTGPATAFRKHERKWKRDTQYWSSLQDKYLHPSYARIIAMGPSAVPFILTSLRREPDDWFYALRALTGANPVSTADAGNMSKMAQAWIDWGARRGLV